jgi:hypothetical protein
MTDQDHPISLTVHSMPEPAVGDAQDPARTRKGRVWMLIVFLICAAPVVASYFTYYVIQPKGDPRFGELIQPSRAIPDVGATDLNGQTHSLPSLRKQWLLISVGSGSCDAACQERLYYQRQILVGLGKERDRTEWIWLIHDDEAISPSLMPGLKEATLLRVKPSDLMAWFQLSTLAELENHFYLVDPMGEWMMRVPGQLDKASALKVRKDLERLLRASSSWDTAGR